MKIGRINLFWFRIIFNFKYEENEIAQIAKFTIQKQEIIKIMEHSLSLFLSNSFLSLYYSLSLSLSLSLLQSQPRQSVPTPVERTKKIQPHNTNSANTYVLQHL